MKVALVAFFLVVALVASAGCGGGGGDGDKTFEGDGYSFTYPRGWDEQEIGEVTPGAVLTTTFAPGEGSSGLIFEINDDVTPVTESNIDAVAEDIARGIQEITEGPTRLTVAGLPSLRIVTHPQSGLTQRITIVFDGETHYTFDCRFTPLRAQEMRQGCDEVEESFQVE